MPLLDSAREMTRNKGNKGEREAAKLHSRTPVLTRKD